MDPTPIIFILIMIVGMWFLIIRPQKKRQTAHLKTVESVCPGARVMLASGVYATVASVGETTIRAEIAPGVEIEVLKRAIAEVVTATDATPQTSADPASDPIAPPSALATTVPDTHGESSLDGVTRTDLPEGPDAPRAADPKPPSA